MSFPELESREHKELLMELTTTPYWKALKREAERSMSSYRDRLLAPASSEFDLIAKEAISAKYDALRRFFAEIEREADKSARK